jgi:DNA-binding NtrC family response regulator
MEDHMKKPEVLLLDDEPIVGNRLKGSLEKIGCTVEVFQEPLKALERLTEHPFEIIVTDIMMENVNGIQVLERAQRLNPETKVIIITGFATTDLAREAMEKGAFDVLAKPFRPGDLRNIVAKAMQKLGYQPAAEA